jgi:hypothetical protein
MRTMLPLLLHPLLLPAPLHGQPTEMNGLRRASGGSPNRLLPFLHAPEVGKNAHTAGMHVHHGRVLIRVSPVLADILNHQLLGLGFHIGADEAGEVQVGPAVQVQLVLEHLVHSIGGSAILRDLILLKAFKPYYKKM